MKTYIQIALGILFFQSLQAQVAVEKEYTGNPSVLLEFNDTRDAAIVDAAENTQAISGEEKTLVLPIVKSIDASSVEGTIWFDANDDRVKYKTANTLYPEIINLTEKGPDESCPTDTNPSLTEISQNGTIIGDTSSTAKGILVLDSSDRAMVLPVVSVANIVNPEPGSIVYDKQEKALAFFNGERWFFWGDYTN